MTENQGKGARKKVLMVHNFYQIGGGEHTVFENEQKLLREHGHELTVYTRDNAELNESVLKKVLLPFSAVFSLKTYREVKRIIRDKKIDIVHCQNTFPLVSPSVYYAAWKCGVPVVQTVHNFRFLCPCGLFFRDGHACEECTERGLGCALKHACYRNSKLQTLVVVNMLRVHRFLGTYRKLRYIFLTDFNRKKFRTLLGSKADREFVKGNFEYVTLPEDIKRDGSFVYIGRLDENKGIRFLMDAWETMTDRDLYVFGDGALMDCVLEAQKKNPRIHPMGFQKQDVIFRYLKAAAAMVFPSLAYEGFPMTLIESFACGTPVVSADIGNQAEIVRAADAGVLYQAGDVESFRRAVDQAASDFERLSRNAEKTYEEQFTPEANYRKLMEIYDAVSR